MDSENVIVVDFQRKPKRKKEIDLDPKVYEWIEEVQEITFLRAEFEEDTSNDDKVIKHHAANNNGVVFPC